LIIKTNNHIIVNATALGSSGGLTILEQFLDAIPSDSYEYVVFVKINIIGNKFSKNNVRIVTKCLGNLGKRLFWDIFGIQMWLRQNKINPLATLSLQNTNFRTGNNIPNFIYYQNAIPFSDNKWNPFRKDERGLWFYKNIYPCFVRLFNNKKTEIFVQSNIIKESFSEFFGFPGEKIHIIRPKTKLPVLTKNLDYIIDRNQLNLFYPATTFIYKNHLTVLNALSMLDIEVQQKITLHLTCDKYDLQGRINFSNLSYKINFMGTIDFKQVHQMYSECDSLLFPSYIETLGLPIIEAAACGMHIIVSDLPYSRDLLDDYSGAVFVPYNNTTSWGNEIIRLFNMKGKRYMPKSFNLSDSWEKMFQIVHDRIDSDSN